MQDKIILGICTIIVFSLGFFVATGWQKQLHAQQVEAAQLESVQYYQDQMKEQALEAEKARVKSACEKSMVYYNMLTSVQKKSTPAPVCN